MRSWLDLVLLAVQLSVAGAGAVLYQASFLGHGGHGSEFFVPSWIALVLSTIPSAYRDHRFFKQYWGFGIFAIQSRFPGKFFPAREEGWLNPVGWALFALVGLHFLLASSVSMLSSKNWNSELGYQGLMLFVGGIMTALVRFYPPTEKPDHS
ncbi:hypothetical protein [Terriglobus sp. TAA 43]|uniref:hypothetical protein n=1 Tax=Terriglobus sp. TAA 43 TaxID=278961 RepID=UPI0006488A4B|nr:hypothetical protein [Terriglobus sp. TAA 43]